MSKCGSFQGDSKGLLLWEMRCSVKLSAPTLREFLEPGAPCEINIDGKTMEKVQHGLKNPTRFTFDAAGDHIYALLLKKDCYPRFVRSEHYKILLATGIQPAHKKRFFGFGGAAKKKASSATPPNAALMAQVKGIYN